MEGNYTLADIVIWASNSQHGCGSVLALAFLQKVRAIRRLTHPGYAFCPWSSILAYLEAEIIIIFL